MIEAGEAEMAARTTAEEDETRAREGALAAASLEQARRETAERARIDAEMERHRAERAFSEATEPEPAASAAEETLQRAPISAPDTVTNVAGAAEEMTRGNGRPDLWEEGRARKTLVKADKQAAKQAAREMAALEKKEARERKALAKAAARRKSA